MDEVGPTGDDTGTIAHLIQVSPSYSCVRRWSVRAALVGLGMLAGTCGASAQESPQLTPTRDVIVIYRSLPTHAPPNGVAKIRMIHADQGRHIRVDFYALPDGDTPFQSLIFDGKEKRLYSLFYAEQSSIERETDNLPLPGFKPDPAAVFTRLGMAKVAGYDCTLWKAGIGRTGDGSICVTDDGVQLQAIGEPRSLEAVSVDFGPPPDDAFTVPPEFRRLIAKPSQHDAAPQTLSGTGGQAAPHE